MNELWMPVVGYEGSYEVSNTGFVRSCERIGNTCYGATRMLKPKSMTIRIDIRGYASIKLNQDGKNKTHRVHRLVMLSFRPINDAETLDVNHIDGNKLNNEISNLEWCTRGENHKHRYKTLKQQHSFLGRVGSLHARSKAVIGKKIKTGESVFFESANQAAIKLSLCASKICACARGERGSHKGYRWEYV